MYSVLKEVIVKHSLTTSYMLTLLRQKAGFPTEVNNLSKQK